MFQPPPPPAALQDCLDELDADIDSLHAEALRQAMARGERLMGPMDLMMVHYETRALCKTLESVVVDRTPPPGTRRRL